MVIGSTARIHRKISNFFFVSTCNIVPLSIFKTDNLKQRTLRTVAVDADGFLGACERQQQQTSCGLSTLRAFRQLRSSQELFPLIFSIPRFAKPVNPWVMTPLRVKQPFHRGHVTGILLIRYFHYNS